MQGHMQVTEEMDQEFEGLFGDGITFRSPGFNPLSQQPSGVPNTTQTLIPSRPFQPLGPGNKHS
jgi:hypothetical protein